MNAKDAIRQTYGLSDQIVHSYLNDLNDADLLIRPTEGMNHIAWQLGHLISSERRFVEAVKPGSSPALPEGFEAAHSKEASTSDDPRQFQTKAEYLRLWQAQREATTAVLEGLSDPELDAPGPDLGRMKPPTIGWLFVMVGDHVMMHVGQWVGVRRKAGKPVVI